MEVNVNEMNKKESFFKNSSASFFLDIDDLSELNEYLHNTNRIDVSSKVVHAEKPGEGNMNYVLRVITEKESFILKQARPWVEKYPQIPAPIERVLVEAQFLSLAQKFPELQKYSASVLWLDSANYLLCTQDLGKGKDFTFLYDRSSHLTENIVYKLSSFLNELHEIPTHELKGFPKNEHMRKLNHAHIFHLPFEKDNGFPLNNIQEGLLSIARPYYSDEILKKKIRELGKIYLSEGSNLIHGDYFPGSWLMANDGPKIIDPEFSFVGYREFDFGVWFAHMTLSGQKHLSLKQLLEAYTSSEQLDQKLILGFAGTEVMRRLIGIAQLPLKRTVKEKEMLLTKAAAWIKEEKIER